MLTASDFQCKNIFELELVIAAPEADNSDGLWHNRAMNTLNTNLSELRYVYWSVFAQ